MSDDIGTADWESDGGAPGVTVAPDAPQVDAAPEAVVPGALVQVVPDGPGELFEVVGDRAVYGVEPGTVGIIVLTPDQRFALIAGGHIKPAAASAPNAA